MTLHQTSFQETRHARETPADRFITDARSATIGFDDIDTNPDGYVAVPDRYHGLTWTNFSATNVAIAYPGDTLTGFYTGITSGEQVAYNRAAAPADVSIANGSFTLKTVELTAGWDLKLRVEIVGYRNGVAVYDKVVSITDHGPTHVDLNYRDVDDVRFISLRGVHDPDQQGGGNLIAFDDFVFDRIKGGHVGTGLADVAKLGAAFGLDAGAPGGSVIHGGHPDMPLPMVHPMA